MSETISVPIAKPVKLPPEASPWWWNPSRPAIREAPEWFKVKLREVDPALRVVWNAYSERWQVWAPRPTIQHPLCAGWIMLFPVQHLDRSYCPLDERTLAKIYEVSAETCGGAKRYFQRIEDEMARDREKAVVDRRNGVNDTAGDYFDYLQPKISMCGESNGSKCSNL